jgi:23S rRNA (adenine2503-C2)-methyltransferase
MIMTEEIKEIKLKQDIRLLTKEQLIEAVIELGFKKSKALLIYEFLWKHGVTNFEEMMTLTPELRTLLTDNFSINPITEHKIQRSDDGTIKGRYRLHDGHLIEAVLIPIVSENRYTVCVSTQVGCSLTCTFCATGRMERKRNLDAAEIFDQVVAINKHSLETFGQPVSNIVYMGMGEPLLTYPNVMRSIGLITEGLLIAPKRITVSTAGIAKMIKKAADDKVKFNLALSLHAADDVKRHQIMPINESNNLETLVESLIYFCAARKKRITLEYIAFQNFNDTLEDAENLVKICKQFPCIVNILEYNPIDNAPLLKSADANIDKFAAYLHQNGIMVTIRRSRGKDIDAACGQLANKG